jgi:polysaccharide biosynthesis transport protein
MDNITPSAGEVQSLRPIPARNYTLAPHLPAESVADSVGLNQLMAALWNRKVFIAGAMLAGVLGGLAIGLLKTPVYRARTSLQLQGFNENYFLHDINSASPVVGTGSAETYLQDQVKILQSETLARRVANEVGIEKNGPAKLGFLPQMPHLFIFGARRRLTPEDLRIRAVRGSLSVRTSLQSEVLEVFYDSPDPELAAKAANAAASEYIAMNREARWQLAQDTTEWLNKQTADLRVKIEKSGQQLQDFARSSGLVIAGPQNGLTDDRIRQLQDALSRAEADRAAKQSRYEAASASFAQDVLPQGLDTGPLRDYQIALGNMRRQLAELKTIYTPDYEKVKRLEAQVNETENAIARERKRIKDGMRTDYAAAVGLERLLLGSYAVEMKKVQDQAEKFNRYSISRHEFETTQQIYDSLLQKEKEAAAAAALQATNIRLIDIARPPTAPYSPNFPLNSALGLAFGAVFGIGFVAVGENSDRLTRPGDSSLFNLPELGVIPSVRPGELSQSAPNSFFPLKRKASPLELVTWDQEASFLSESFRATLASILFSADRTLRTLVLTSVNPREGKTTIVSNLGIALAETKLRVLLVDADLRRPRLHNVFDVCNDWGLTDLLQRSDSIDSVTIDGLARPTRIPGLWVLPAGPGTATIPSLFYSREMKSLLRRLRKEFDFVLIDSPPILPFCDARVLGQVCDGVVLVARANRTSRDQLRSTCIRFLQDSTPILGTILNDLKMDGAGYMKYYHGIRPDANT